MNSGIWELADAIGWPRLLPLMLLSMSVMVVWIIVAHRLWEAPSHRESLYWTGLYNGVTALTITIAVLFAYATLFTLVLLVAVVFVPSGYFQAVLQHPIGVSE